MESLDLLWGMGCTLAVALIAYGAFLCLSVDQRFPDKSAAAQLADEVNSSHAGTAPGHSPG